WESAPRGKIVKSDVVVAKNYLNARELEYLERIVSVYLDFAELQAMRKIPMSMQDWAKRLDGFLEFNGNEILTGPGKISHEQARLHAETEFEKYRITQDRLFESDFDRLLKEAEPPRLEPSRKPRKKKGDDNLAAPGDGEAEPVEEGDE
ncbi:MAG: virulence RhuM family protein, partial [Candidatus Accumulibacter sp.]|nr:virulence RhuM family protein [Accumulibacter sp.]